MELPKLGEHCQVCNRNDYLPFKCSYCNKLVCLDHKTNHSDCPINAQTFSNQETNANQVATKLLKETCHFCNASFLKLELVNCNHCSKAHCLSHRHQHDCPSIKEETESKVRAQELAEKSLKAIEQLKPHLKPGISKSKKASAIPQDNSKIAKRVRLMKLKLNSRGVFGTPIENRIYLLCKYCHNPESLPSQECDDGRCINFYASPDQYVGRLVDWTVLELNIYCPQNSAQDVDRLVFQKVLDDGTRLTFDSNACFKFYLSSGQLESGDEVLLTFSRSDC